LNKVRKELKEGWGDNITVQLFSSLKKQGVEEAEKVLGHWFFSDNSGTSENQIPNPVA
jgi:GTP-binding protein